MRLPLRSKGHSHELFRYCFNLQSESFTKLNAIIVARRISLASRLQTCHRRHIEWRRWCDSVSVYRVRINIYSDVQKKRNLLLPRRWLAEDFSVLNQKTKLLPNTALTNVSKVSVDFVRDWNLSNFLIIFTPRHNQDLGRDPFNQNFRKFRSKPQWITVRSNPKSFEKTGPPFEVEHFSRLDRLEFWLNGSRPWSVQGFDCVTTRFDICICRRILTKK